jgi:serine/threonine-protein kinase
VSRSLQPGDTLGRYRIVRRLGAGAMGAVYLAEDPQIERQLAIKTVLLGDDRGHDEGDLGRRLLREARTTGKLIHPHIVTLFDADEQQGLLYLAFEYVAGSDLLQRMKAEPALTAGEILRIIREAAEGLEYAHQHGIVHRDVKPSNILLDQRGRVKVADFGIAKFSGQTSEMTMDGSVVGSPQYLSPEQVRGDQLDGRSDVFSLGVVLWELLIRSRPFAGDTLTTIVYQILHKDPPPLDRLWPSVPAGVATLVARMLAKDRDARFATAAEVARAVSELERSLPPAFLAAVPLADETELQATRQLQAATAATLMKPPPPTLQSPMGAGAPPPLPPPPAMAAATGPASPPSAVPPAADAPPGRPLALVGIVLAVVLLAGGVGGWLILKPRLTKPSAPPVNPTTTASLGGDQREPLPSLAPPTSGQAAAAPTTAGKPTPSAPIPAPAPAVAEREPAPTPAANRPAAERKPAASDTRQSSPSRPAEAAGERVAPRSGSQAPTSAATATPTAPAPSRPTPSQPEPPAVRPEPTPEAVKPARPAPEPPPAVDFDRELTAGLGLVLDVKPEESFVLVREVSERRAANIGQAKDWNDEEHDDLPARYYQLAEPGDYVVTVRPPGGGDYVILVHALASGPTKTTIKLELAKGRKR